MKSRVCFIRIVALMLAVLLSSSLLAQYASLNKAKLNSTTENAEFIPRFLLNPISIDLENVSLAEALSAISKKGQLRLTYSNSLIPAQRKVSVQAKNTPVVEVLGKVLYESGTSFTVNKNGQVLLFPSNELGKVLYASGISFTVSEGGQVLFFPSREIESGLYIPTTGAISGKVIDSRSGEGLPGANVLLKGTAIGAASASDGSFTIENVPPGSYAVVVSFIGYHTQETDVQVIVNEVANLTFSLTEDIFSGEEVVVTGIASRTSRAVAEVAVSRIKASNYTEMNTYQTTQQLINGKIAGVRVNTTSGNVGAGFRFTVRSTGGLNGQEQPVIYVDGVRFDNSEVNSPGFDIGGQGISMFADLNPEDIENIEILKGPAAAASYGTNGANGVVLITTKKGRLTAAGAKNVNINYKVVRGWNQNPKEYGADEYVTADTFNTIFKTGSIIQHNISAAGGSNILRYFASFNSRIEEGTLIRHNSKMDRKNIRINIDAVPSGQFTFRVNAGYTYNTIDRPDGDNSLAGELANILIAPFGRLIYAQNSQSAIASIFDRTLTNRFIGSVQAEWTPIRNLTARANIGIDDHDLRADKVFPVSEKYAVAQQDAGSKQIFNRRSTNYTYNFDARYSFNPTEDLNVSAVVGTQMFDRKVKGSRSSKFGFPNDLIINIDSGAELAALDETFSHRREAGVFGEANFSYNNQYFASVKLRRDYASVVGQKAPSIFYPGASFALRLDQYDGFPSQFNLMKLRVAYGETGILPVLLDGIPLLWTAAPWGGGPTGGVVGTIGNAGVEPERIKELELGVDLEFLNNYALEVTHYRQKAENSIIGFLDAPSTGKTVTSIPFNVGEAKGWGWETLLQGSPIRTRNFSVNFTLINNYQDNEVQDLGGAQPIFFPGFTALNVVKEGLPKHEFYEFRVFGAKFDDNGVYAGPEVSTEFEALGNPVPNYTGSLSLNLRLFKNFNIYVLTDWGTGNKMFNETNVFAARFGNRTRFNELANLLGLAGTGALGNVAFFAPPDDDITPLTPGSAEYKTAAEEFARLDWRFKHNYVEDADYFRMREVSVSYNFRNLLPKLFRSGNIFLNELVVALSITNVFSSTKFSTGDVDANFTGARTSSRGQYFNTLPIPRSYNLSFRFGL